MAFAEDAPYTWVMFVNDKTRAACKTFCRILIWYGSFIVKLLSKLSKRRGLKRRFLCESCVRLWYWEHISICKNMICLNKIKEKINKSMNFMSSKMMYCRGKNSNIANKVYNWYIRSIIGLMIHQIISYRCEMETISSSASQLNRFQFSISSFFMWSGGSTHNLLDDEYIISKFIVNEMKP